ncbi:hypothetical protein J6590_072876 [Homalodisca vitripennis]|nr:hypothetical protein J6590_072876 [Homalodisca vitripennis]
MRVLTPSPPTQRRLPLVTTPRPAGSSPFTTTSSSTPESASSTDIPPAPAPASPLHSNNAPATLSHIAEDSSGEISTLKNEITRLNNEMRGLLDHAIESDMRLLKFTDQIFVSDASISDNKENRPTTQDCSIRCDLPLNESSSEPIATRDSHTRHIAGLTRGLVDSSTSITGVCKPGARLLDIVSLPQLTPPPASTVGLDQPASPPGPRRHWEVLIAGTNDLATGAQHTIYQHLEQYITNRPADTQLVVATMPHRHDLQDPENPIHDETKLVNAFIEELAARHDIQVLRLDTISRKYFTRHGLYLSMRGKRLLAEMLVRCLTTPKTRPVCTDSRLSANAPTPQPCTSRAVPPVAPPPVPTSPPLPSSPTPSLTLLGPASSPSSPSTSTPLTLPHITFAEVVAGTSKPNSIAETTSTQYFLVEAPPLIPIKI